MATTQRHAEAKWNGNLIHGKGIVTVDSGVLNGQPVSWAARTEAVGNMTSPEELIAAAHAACFAMAFSHALDQAGHPPQSLTVNATCDFDRKPEGGFKVSAMHLSVRGQVPGLDNATFAQMAQDAEKGCPVSNALRNNVAIDVQAELEN